LLEYGNCIQANWQIIDLLEEESFDAALYETLVKDTSFLVMGALLVCDTYTLIRGIFPVQSNSILVALLETCS
jgi:hypothetical protein